MNPPPWTSPVDPSQYADVAERVDPALRVRQVSWTEHANLSRSKLAILKCIDESWERNWTSPTVKEICTAVGLASTATVHKHLTDLVRMGYLERKALSERRVLYRVRQ